MNSLLEYENRFWGRGVQYLAGVDEAGRGPLAGPIVAAAVILNREHLTNNDVLSEDNMDKYQKINDSKKLSRKRREELFLFIKSNSISYSIVEISHKEIDKRGVGVANKIALKLAVENLKIKPQHILSDHYKIEKWGERLQTNLVKGDSKSISIASASILAKVYRDKIMIEHNKKYPDYGFDKHKGYGTKYHREKILEIGPCDIHRKSFEPIKSYLKQS